MTRDAQGTKLPVQRKQARPSRARGKAGYRRLEAVLEAANLVVQRVETENDIGRDAFVDIVAGSDVTGGVVCVQVKSGPSYFWDGRWVVPGEPADFTLWRESTVPIFGVVHDPVTDTLRWVDLTKAAESALDEYLSPVVKGPFGKASVPVPEVNRLDVDAQSFIAAAQTALRRRSGSHVAALLSDELTTVEAGIADTFAIGRHDPDSFLLLAALFHRLPNEVRRYAVEALAMATSHPDVFWSKDNWIPRSTSNVLRQRVRWTDADVVALLAEVDDNGFQRGTIGQSVYHVLDLDRGFESRLPRIALNRALTDDVRRWAVVLFLYRSGAEAPSALEALLGEDRKLSSRDVLFQPWRDLHEIDHFEIITETIADFGQLDIF